MLSPPALKWRDGWYEVEESTSGINDRPDGTAHIVRRRRVTTKISQAKYGALLGIVERYWKKRGYKITTINADERMPAINAATPDGGFCADRLPGKRHLHCRRPLH